MKNGRLRLEWMGGVPSERRKRLPQASIDQLKEAFQNTWTIIMNMQQYIETLGNDETAVMNARRAIMVAYDNMAIVTTMREEFNLW